MSVTRWDIVSTRSGKDGKKRYHKIGSMFPGREGNGFSIILDSLPLPNEKGEVWLSAWEPKPRDGEPKPARSSNGLGESFIDEVPF